MKYRHAAFPALALLGALSFSSAARADDVRWSVSIGTAPVVVAPLHGHAPVYIHPAPVYVQPSPAYAYPPTVYVLPPPVYTPPRVVYIDPRPGLPAYPAHSHSHSHSHSHTSTWQPPGSAAAWAAANGGRVPFTVGVPPGHRHGKGHGHPWHAHGQGQRGGH